MRSVKREPVPSAFEEAHALRMARVLVVILALLAVARAVLTFVPTMWAWSLNLQRFLEPAMAWGPWLLAAASLVPSITRRAVPFMQRIGDAIADHPIAAGWTMAAIAACLVAVFPDRTRFVGDFLLRQGTVEQGGAPSQLFPQALPLDVLLHYRLPHVFTSAGVLDANGAARLLGACEAAALAALAGAFARALALRGVPAATAAAIVFFGGYVGIFTGFGKAFAELVLVVAALGVLGLGVVRHGRGLLPLGLVFAAALALHRSALVTVPAVAMAWRIGLRADRDARRTPRRWLVLSIPIVALAVMLPRLIAIMRVWDAAHIAPHDVQVAGGPLRAALAGLRVPDMANLVVFLSPLSVAVVPLLCVARGASPRGRELAFLLALSLPIVLALPFIHPAQGLYRDWDDFVTLGAATSLVAAWLVAETLRAAPRFAWVGVATSLAVAAPCVQWVVHWADADSGLERVEAFMREPPARTTAERSTTWDYLGIRNLRIGRLDAAAAAFARSSEAAPNPRVLLELGYAERARGDLRGAARAYQRVLERDSTHVVAWTLYGTASAQLGDTLAVVEAEAALARLDSLSARRPR